MGFDFNDICFDDEIEGKKLEVVKHKPSYISNTDIIDDAINMLKQNNCKQKYIYSTLKLASVQYHKGRFESLNGRIYFNSIPVINYMTGRHFLYCELLSPKEV